MVVLASDYDALAQQLADCQVLASGYKEQCDSLVNVAFDRDKQLADAVGLLRCALGYWASAEKGEMPAAMSKAMPPIRAFLTTIEQDKENY